MAMMAMTTRSSINVKPERPRGAKGAVPCCETEKRAMR